MPKSKQNSGLTKHRRSIALLMTASFYFLCVDILADNAIMDRFSENAFLWLRVAYLIVMGIGFASFSGLQRVTATAAKRRLALLLLYVVSIAALFGVVLIKLPWLFTLCVMVNLFTAGMIGASVYFYAAIELFKSGCTGRVCALGIGGAALLQVLLMIAAPPAWIGAVVLALSLVATGWLTLRKTTQALPDFDLAYTPSGPKPDKRSVLFLLLIIAVISMMGGINDGTLTLLNASGDLRLYSFPRLFYLVGVIATGFIADYKNRKYLAVSVMAVMLCAAIGILFLDGTVMLNANACVYSLFAGFAVIFITVPLFDLAPKTDHPSLWAGMGRAVRLPFLALGAILMECLLKRLPFSVTTGTFILLSAVLVLMFWQAGFLSPQPQQAKLTPDERLSLFAARYGLTPRETEVLAAVSGSEKALGVLAVELGISERIVQRHLTSIYEKTGTQTRYALVLALHGIELRSK